MDKKWSGHDPGCREEEKYGKSDNDFSHDLPTPNSPEGLNNKTSKKITNPMASLYGTET
jgi:hypothetical protein